MTSPFRIAAEPLPVSVLWALTRRADSLGSCVDSCPSGWGSRNAPQQNLGIFAFCSASISCLSTQSRSRFSWDGSTADSPQVAEDNRNRAVARKRYLTAFNKTILMANLYSGYSNLSRLEIDDS